MRMHCPSGENMKAGINLSGKGEGDIQIHSSLVAGKPPLASAKHGRVNAVVMLTAKKHRGRRKSW